MLDMKAPLGNQNSLQDYIEREPGYDLAFCAAWKEVDSVKDEKVETPNKLLYLLDQIQRCALQHLPRVRQVDKGYQIIHGRAEMNYFGLTDNVNCNLEGIKEVIRKIWIDQNPFTLITIDEMNPKRRLILTKDCFFASYSDEQKNKTIENYRASTAEATCNTITKQLAGHFQKGICQNGLDRMILFINIPLKEREKMALSILDSYFVEKTHAVSPEAKIKTIFKAISALSQLHLYYDGNGRSLYMLANLLLYQEGLPLFYPENMCIFEASDINTITKKILEGQDRFKILFGTAKTISKGLTEYAEAVIKTKKIIADNYPTNSYLNRSFTSRNFNLLLRQCAIDKKYFPLLKFLVNNSTILSIDLSSRGKKSGSAIDIAKSNNNSDAIQLLNRYANQSN